VCLARSSSKGFLLGALLVLAGCGPKDGLSDNDRRILGVQNAAEDLKSQGAKIEQRTYPIGNGWVVDLSGMKITDKVLRQVKSLGPIGEINLSKSTLGDEHMALFNELEIGGLAWKIDLSDTAVTDAGFEKLDILRYLGYLNLKGTKVTPTAVEKFKTKRQGDNRVSAQFKNPKIVMN